VGLASLYEDIERPLIGVLAEMERHGIRIDQVRLGEFSRELEVHLERTTREIFGLAGEEFNIGSPKQLAYILFEKLKLPPVRRTKTGYSTDADVRSNWPWATSCPRASSSTAPWPSSSRRTPTRCHAGEPHHRAPAHLVQPVGGRHGKAFVEQPELTAATTAHRIAVVRAGALGASAPSPRTARLPK